MQPRVTVVAATHNRARRLEALLASLAEQTIGTEAFEVVIVDDASQDDTPAVLERALAGPLDLRVLRQAEGGGQAAARNAGWRAATAPVVAFTDDDCVCARDWLER